MNTAQWIRLRPCLTALLCTAFATLTAGCAGTSSSSQARSPMMQNCSERVIINFHQGLGINSDFELANAARRAGANLDVLQSITRTSKMVMIRGVGPQQVCREAIEQLRNDPRIESIENYF